MLDTVSGHETIVTDNGFAYDKDMKKVYGLDARRNLLD